MLVCSASALLVNNTGNIYFKIEVMIACTIILLSTKSKLNRLIGAIFLIRAVIMLAFFKYNIYLYINNILLIVQMVVLSAGFFGGGRKNTAYNYIVTSYDYLLRRNTASNNRERQSIKKSVLQTIRENKMRTKDKLIILILMMVGAGIMQTASATDLNLILDTSYAVDGKESFTDVKTGVEIYNKKYGSLTIGIGYEGRKTDYFGTIEKKSNQGVYIQYQGYYRIRSF